MVDVLHVVAQFVGGVSHVALIVSLIAISIFGAPLIWLCASHVRLRATALQQERALLSSPLPPDSQLPHVLVQIPSFNEGGLVRRIAEAIGDLDWPHDKLHVQMLDDSTDESVTVAADAIAMLRERGIDAILLHRTQRAGFKAGALAAGLAQSTCEFVAIFDVYYLPPRGFLRACMRPMLIEPRLGLVQARCDYLNANENKLTAVQQRLLDAHFAVEQATRSWLDLVVPFNGTCGIWRRAAIQEAGGWQGDTLAEDMDLSYRAQSLGWKGRYLVTVTVPGELPGSFEAWRAQQSRWTKGYAQTSRKLLPMIGRSKLTPRAKAAAILHLGSSATGPVICTALTALPVDLLFGKGMTPLMGTLLCLALTMGLSGGIAQVLLGQRLARNSAASIEVRKLPAVAWLSLRVTFSNVRGILEAFMGHASSFVRTPKRLTPAQAVTAAREDH